MTREELNNFTKKLSETDYGDLYISLVVDHINNDIPIQRAINLDIYYKDEYQRIRLITALKYIDCSDMLEKRRLYFKEGNTLNNFYFKVDTKIVYKAKDIWD